ncbi:MAG: SRPBCC family protein [Gordonia sp. (in: high G+C Gram-positive bacteria)]|uniref:SRPBCC family protein n=1 Tax=Gordonia sp. (in: high G+C Gram-positive bacteria) TaxID=84139 RepID=UPI0039E477A1
MTRTTRVSESIVVAADPAVVYDVVSHPDRIPEFSPENTRGVVDDPDRAAYAGMTFTGWNRRLGFRWSTRCEVTAADPNRRFEFAVRRWGFGPVMAPVAVATWTFTLEPVDGGTRVTETWTDDRGWPDGVAAVFDRIVTGKPGFAEFQRGNIAESLKRLKRLIEG